MCRALPMKLIARSGVSGGMVELDGVRREVNLRLLPQVEIGDYVLEHAGFAIQKLDPQAALETLELIRITILESQEGGGAVPAKMCA